MSGAAFATRLIAWQQAHGRHDLPWQNTDDPYRIWLSEIMLQQTQVAAVAPFFERFLARFPDLFALAAAHEDAVLTLWAGLGYYARARHLHRAAQTIVQHHGGVFPRALEAVRALPGVGRSTAAAICAFAYGTRVAILDGNVKRVLTRQFGVDGYPGERRIENALWALSESLLPEADIAAYTQGLMDLGATLCVRAKPRCDTCPVQDTCVARRDGRTRELPRRRDDAAGRRVVCHDALRLEGGKWGPRQPRSARISGARGLHGCRPGRACLRCARRSHAPDRLQAAAEG